MERSGMASCCHLQELMYTANAMGSRKCIATRDVKVIMLIRRREIILKM